MMTYARFKEIAFPKVSCKYGAPMGRMSLPIPYDADGNRVKSSDPRDVGKRVYRRIVPIDSGGYDRGGAYWGLGKPLYCEFTADGEYVQYYRA